MKIHPTPKNFLAWSKAIPTNGDLLFSQTGKEPWIRAIGAPFLSLEQARVAQISTLQHRSWYAYALARSKGCVKLPTGKLEKINPALLAQIAATQIKLQVPTLISRNHLRSPKGLQIKNRQWITAATFKNASKKQKLQIMKAWHKENEIFTYTSITNTKLPKETKQTLKHLKIYNKLNTFAPASGPNCFALAAAAITKNPNKAKLWLHLEPLAKILQKNSYHPIEGKNFLAGDILVFKREKQEVHAAVYLGNGIYMEKPGQDFYEPYRIAKLRNWREEWKDCELISWRRQIY